MPTLRHRWLLALASIALVGVPVAARANFFRDVPDGYPYATSIDLLRERGIIEGFFHPSERRVFWPDQSITRAEFVKMVVLALYPQTLVSSCLTDQAALEKYGLGFHFVDISSDDWFAPYVCVAWTKGLISGFGDGSFRPDNALFLAEGAKILSVAFGLAPARLPDLEAVGEEWYKPYITYLTTAQAIPQTAQGYAHRLTRGEVAEMIARLLKLPSEDLPPSMITLDAVEIANPVRWKEYQRGELGFILSYPDSWPLPRELSRGTYDRDQWPKLRSNWKIYVGPEKLCSGSNVCVERDFSLSSFPRTLADKAVTELTDATNARTISDETVGGVRTILFEELQPSCLTRSAYLITLHQFLRFSLHCGSTLHNPETAFMRLLGHLQITKE